MKEGQSKKKRQSYTHANSALHCMTVGDFIPSEPGTLNDTATKELSELGLPYMKLTAMFTAGLYSCTTALILLAPAVIDNAGLRRGLYNFRLASIAHYD